MTVCALHHLVLNIADLRTAEVFYRDLFGMSVRFREGRSGDEYGKIPDNFDWDDITAAGVEPKMSFLGWGAFTLALVAEDKSITTDRLNHVALSVEKEDFTAIPNRASGLDCDVERIGTEDSPDAISIDDPYGVEWELYTESPPPNCPFEPLEL